MHLSACMGEILSFLFIISIIIIIIIIIYHNNLHVNSRFSWYYILMYTCLYHNVSRLKRNCNLHEEKERNLKLDVFSTIDWKTHFLLRHTIYIFMLNVKIRIDLHVYVYSCHLKRTLKCYMRIRVLFYILKSFHEYFQ